MTEQMPDDKPQKLSPDDQTLAVQPAEDTDLTLTPDSNATIRLLARKMAEVYQNTVEAYEKQHNLDYTDAVSKANEHKAGYSQFLLTQPPEETTWYDLNELREADPEMALARWEEIQNVAREDLDSGEFMLNAADPSPIERAKFLAIREAFIDMWLPKNKGEQLLVDMLAQLFHQWLYWQDRVNVRSSYEMELEQGELKRTSKWKPNRLTVYDMQFQGTEMVDRFNRLFLRTLKALRDLRRWSAPVTINNAEQVNIASQQVNAQQVTLPRPEED